MLECCVYQVMSKTKIVGVLETGCVAEIDFEESMDQDSFERLCRSCNCFYPQLVGLDKNIYWNSNKKRLQCKKLECLLT